jgi:DNA-directed RNA polymerase subunit K/omega
MSARSRLLAEAEKQISNPFLLCALASLRTRQLMMTGNANTSTAQLVDSALNELIAGALEFERRKPRRPSLIRAESGNEESSGGLESPGVPAVSRTFSAEAP